MKTIRQAFGESLVEFGKTNSKIVAISCDLKNACKLDLFFKKFPERSFEIGIAEANAIGIATGLALSGFRPFLASFGSFITGKNIEIRTSISYNLAPVVIVGTHGGLIGADGATQAALQDIAVMRTIPNFDLFQPCSPHNTRCIIEYASKTKKPTYIRIARNEVEEFLDSNHKFIIGEPDHLIVGKKNVIISSGPMVRNCIDAINLSGTDKFGLINISSLKPLNENSIINLINKYEKILIVEDHLINGGLGSIISEIITKNGIGKKIYFHGLNDEFIESDTPENLAKNYKLDSQGILSIISNI